MKKILSIVLSLASILANAQRLPDCLRTSEYFKDGYRALVERMLLPESTEDEYNDLRFGRIWGIVILPSFSQEESVYCLRTSFGFKLVMRLPENSIWYTARHITYDEKKSTTPSGIQVSSMERNNVRWEDVELDMNVKVRELNITREQASVLSELFRMAINTSTSLMSSYESYSIVTKENGEKEIQKYEGLDGETTLFFYNGCAAECWSPEEGKLKRLIDIRQAIRDAIDNNDNGIIQDALPEARALTLEFRELLPDWAKEYLELSE